MKRILITTPGTKCAGCANVFPHDLYRGVTGAPGGDVEPGYPAIEIDGRPYHEPCAREKERNL